MNDNAHENKGAGKVEPPVKKLSSPALLFLTPGVWSNIISGLLILAIAAIPTGVVKVFLLDDSIKDLNTTIENKIDNIQTNVEQLFNQNLMTSSKILRNAVIEANNGNTEMAKGILQTLDLFLGTLAVERGQSPSSSIALFSPSLGSEYNLKDHLKQISKNSVSNSIDTLISPQWHPLLPQILFSGKTTKDGWDLYIYDFVLESIVKVTHSSAIELEGKWSPDGRYIAYTELSKHVFNGETQNGLVVKIIKVPESKKLFTSSKTDSSNFKEITTLGYSETGFNSNVYFPVFSPFDGWITVTASNANEGFTIYMYNWLDSLNYQIQPLFSDATFGECKGNWGFDIRKNQNVFVYNRYQEDDKGASIRVATVKQSSSDSKQFFSVLKDESIVNDEYENHFPEFGITPDTIFFASINVDKTSSKTKAKIKRVVRNNSSEYYSKPEIFLTSKRFSYERPDWRPVYNIEILQDFYATWSKGFRDDSWRSQL